MKIRYTLIFLLLSYALNAKEITQHKSIAQEKVKEAADISTIENNVSFDTVIKDIKTKALPVIDATDFNSFKEENFYRKSEVAVLNLERIYPHFYEQGYNYKAKASYRINISTDFHSIVITILKGENEMESVLINYDLKGSIIDSKVISYDEMAEGMFKVESIIEHDRITTDYIQWLDEKQIERKLFKIKNTGEIEPVS